MLQAVIKYGQPEIIKADQGSQFTCPLWVEHLQANKINISMDGKGRALDNIYIERLWRTVKQDCVYLNPAQDGEELYKGLTNYKMVAGSFKRFLLIMLIATSGSALFAGKSTPDSLLIKYHNANNDSIKVQALREIVNYWKTGDPDSIMRYSKILIKEALNINNITMAYKGYYWVINNYGNRSEYDSALFYAFSGLEHCLNYGATYPTSILLILIGEQYRALAQYDNALTYLNQAWIVADTGKQEKLNPSIANRIASVYYEKGLLDSTLIWIGKSIYFSKKNNRHEYDVNNLLLKGAVSRDQKNYKDALDNFNKALAMVKPSASDYDISSILNNISSTYALMEDWEHVIKFAEESYQYSSLKNIKALSMVSSELLSNAYYETGDFKQAYKFSRLYEQLRNDIFFEERDKQISELNTKYNLQQKENQIEIQKINIGKKDLQIKQNNTITIIIIAALALLIVFLIFRYRVYRRLKIVNFQLNEKNDLIVKQKNEIENYSKKINDAYTKLQELDEYKQATTNMLVHDLKNPLNSLVNIDRFKNEAESKSTVVRTSKQMLRLIMNLLDINKAENNKMKLDFANVNLFDVIQSSFQEIEYLCKLKNISIVNKSSFNVNVKADYNALSRVFINLLTNAIKFSPANSTIIINSEITNDKLLKVSVFDNGPGIAKEHYKTIFEKFTQVVDVRSGAAGSSGIGLAYCKLAVESHGWTMGVESELNKGAEFWILINDFNLVESSGRSAVNTDIKEVENDNFDISKSDKQKLEPYLRQLLKTDVYAISEVKKIVLAVRKDSINNIEPWLQKILFATATLNEEKFVFLIKSLLNG